MNVLKLVIVGFFILNITSCTNDKESDISVIPCVDEFTYTACVKEIIDSNCVICHNSGADAIAPFPLETYAQVVEKTENDGPLLFRIQLPDGDPQIMPQTGKMPQVTIDVIVAWAEGGLLE